MPENRFEQYTLISRILGDPRGVRRDPGRRRAGRPLSGVARGPACPDRGAGRTVTTRLGYPASRRPSSTIAGVSAATTHEAGAAIATGRDTSAEAAPASWSGRFVSMIAESVGPTGSGRNPAIPGTTNSSAATGCDATSLVPFPANGEWRL
jgi:hypothetical protein